MNAYERVMAVVAGEPPDRPPVSFWYHFPADRREGEAAVQAHFDHRAAYDLDFLKVMYDLGYPTAEPIRSAGRLKSLAVLDGDYGPFGRHLATIRALSRELHNRVPIATTIFNPWATLRRLVRDEPYEPRPSGQPLGEDQPGQRIERFMREDREAVRRALGVIGESLANFAARCIEAGADGIFLCVRDDWVDTPANGPGTYDELVRPLDLRILRAASRGRFNMLHVCGRALNFRAFSDYPVQVINWADRTSGPSINDVARSLGPAPCGGIDHLETLPNGTPDACSAEVRDALASAGGRPILVAPGCTYDPDRVPIANLRAVRAAVDRHG